jgi:hypothetical protein
MKIATKNEELDHEQWANSGFFYPARSLAGDSTNRRNVLSPRGMKRMLADGRPARAPAATTTTHGRTGNDKGSA